MVCSPDGCWHACNVCISHQHLATGTAPAFGRAFAPCDGSDLLPLRLRSTCSWVTRFLRAAPRRRFCELCQTRPLPAAQCPFRAPHCGPGLLVGWTHRNTVLRPDCTVATITLWVTALVQGLKLALDLTRLGHGFLVRAWPHSSLVAILDRLRHRPEELVIFAYLRLAPLRGGRHQLPPSFPRLPGIIPVALSAGFSCRRTATVLSRNDEKLRGDFPKVTGLFLSTYSLRPRRKFALALVNNLCPTRCPQVVHKDASAPVICAPARAQDLRRPNSSFRKFLLAAHRRWRVRIASSQPTNEFIVSVFSKELGGTASI